MKPFLFLLFLLFAGCSMASVPALKDHDVVTMNPLCLAICFANLTVADTDQVGPGSSSTSQNNTQGIVQ